MRNQIKFLIDGADAQSLRMFWVLNFHLSAVENDLALGLLIRPAQNFHQGGFACAILTKKYVDLAAPQFKIDLVQGHYTGERLPYLTHFQNWAICHIGVTFSGAVARLSRRAAVLEVEPSLTVGLPPRTLEPR